MPPAIGRDPTRMMRGFSISKSFHPGITDSDYSHDAPGNALIDSPDRSIGSE